LHRRHFFLAFLAIFGLCARGSIVVAGSSGSLQINLLGNSDTFVTLPYVRPEVASGLVQSVSGSVVNVTGPTGWSTGQFVYSSGIQTNTYFIIIRSGAKEGFWYTITANDSTSLTLNLMGDSLSGLTANDQFDIIPYWTLATFFPNGQGINVSPRRAIDRRKCLFTKSTQWASTWPRAGFIIFGRESGGSWNGQ
jgi:uncharacterized protein (TIGR02597 family)